MNRAVIPALLGLLLLLPGCATGMGLRALEDENARLLNENQRLSEENDQLWHNLAMVQEQYQILLYTTSDADAASFPVDLSIPFETLATQFPGHYVHEHWQSLDNADRLEVFAENYRTGTADYLLLAQDSNPLTYYYLLWYPGGNGYYLFPLDAFQDLAQPPEYLDQITLIDSIYYFTLGDIQVADGIITYTTDGEVVSVPFDAYPKAENQPLKIGLSGSGFQHP